MTEPVSCGPCADYLPNQNGQGGIGRCKSFEAGKAKATQPEIVRAEAARQMHKLLYPNILRYCRKFIPLNQE